MVRAAMVVGAVLLLAISASAEPLCTDRDSCQDALSILHEAKGPAIELASFVLDGVVDSRADEHWNAQPFSDVDTQWCPSNSYYEFIPVQMGSLPASGGSVKWTASCFQSTSAQFQFDASGTTGKITLQTSNASTLICEDVYLFSTAYRTLFLDVGTLTTNRTVSFPTFAAGEADDIKTNGVQAFVLPCGIVGTIESALLTYSLFSGSAEQMSAANTDFLLKRKIFDKLEPFGKVQSIPASMIKSGDYFAISRFDGLDPLVMFGTGGRTGHSTVAVWEGSQLYVCESTDKNPFGESYWPPPYGIIRTPYDQWITQAIAASYHVALLPLTTQQAKFFDESKFWTWFYTVQGQPYGYHNFMFTFFDTWPMRNLPQPIVDATYTWALTAADRLLPNSTEGVSVYALFTEGLNHRLNTTCGSMECLVTYLNKQKSSLGKVSALPEDDNWRYDNGNVSMVCSVFAAHSWKAGMGSNWPSIEACEQTPKDNYQMAIYDGKFFTSSNCPIGLVTTPSGSYCQLMGQYQLVLNNYNTIPLYANMNNACPSQWPDYERCPASNPTCC